MYGVALEGGGARGAYQVGVWKALRELGIEYTGVVGTSVGALNGAMMVQGDFQKAFDIWSDIEPSKVMDFDANLKEIDLKEMKLDHTLKLLRHIKLIFKEKGIDITPLRELLFQYIDEERIRKSGIEFGIVTVSLSDLNPMKLFLDDIPQGKLIDYLIASARLPVFQKYTIDGKVYLDGGFYDNFPVNLLMAKGYQDIIAVRLTRIGIKRWDNVQSANIIIISPSDNLGSILDFSHKNARKNMQMGYYDSIRVLKGYQGKKYCINVKNDEKYFFDLLSRIDPEKLEIFSEKYGLSNGMPQLRLIFEKLIPFIMQLLELEAGVSYRDVVITLLDRAAEQLKIERFKIYEYDALIHELAENYRTQTGDLKIKLPKILQGHGLALWAVKDQVLDEMTDLLLSAVK